jgi:uncharacterized membrane protein
MTFLKFFGHYALNYVLNLSMEINYMIIGLIALIAVVIVIVLARRNHRDKEDLEKTLNESALDPEQHKEPESI